MNTATDKTAIAVTLPRSEWRALMVAASIAETLDRHPNMVIAEPGIGPGLHLALDRARTTIAFLTRETEPKPLDVEQLRRNIRDGLDRMPPRRRAVLKNVRATSRGLVKRTRRPMSQKNRKAVSVRMRKYWAAKRKAARS
ncbi:MAG: hypothetical protein ACRD3G_12180 [Vicinamibacterales bacterium]